MEYVITVGLEIHLKLATATKIFCPCKNEQNLDDNHPNTTVCPVCTGQPGALPQLSEEVVKKGLLLGKALKCVVQNPSSFDRKSYFYPDLPMGYQITQFYRPINVNGQLSFFSETFDEERTVTITDAHLECDTAKVLHYNGKMLLDFNRAGTPLIEIVTGPDFQSADQAVAFAKEIQRIAKYNQISDADMEKGQMRVDVNVSIRPSLDAPFGTRVELKNINSFSAIKRAIETEVKRQLACREANDPINQETRRRDDLKGMSFTMRSKEDALDYRYFPEPDLPELQLKNELLDEVNASDILLPYEKIKEMKSDFGFHKEFINVLINDKEVLDFFYDLVKMGFWPKLVAKWIAGPISAYMTANAVAISELKIDKEQLISFFKLAEEGKLIENQLKILMDELLNQWGDLQEIIKEKWFDAPAVSEDEITEVAKGVLDANPQIVEQYKGGKVTVIGFFVGQVMKQTQWKANPKQIQEIMTRLLSA